MPCMDTRLAPGLGELLRFVNELVEQGAEQHYQAMRLNYRARYTPVVRALSAGARTVTEITERTRLTQGAISQTVALLENDGLIVRRALEDGRKSAIQLTAVGRKLSTVLEQHWIATFSAIASLEKEIGFPLMNALDAAAQALERQGFAERIDAAKASLNEGSSHAG